MVFCNGVCKRKCHVKCMGFAWLEFDFSNWYCLRCQSKEERATSFENRMRKSEVEAENKCKEIQKSAEHSDEVEAVSSAEAAPSAEAEATNASTPTKIELKKFWDDGPEIWFAQAEANFIIHGIKDERMKYNHVIASLDKEDILRVEALVNQPPAERPYEVLKERLIESFALSAIERAAHKETASKMQNVDILHCLDQRALLTTNSVLQLASGRWDGTPFVVQIIAAPFTDEETSKTDLQFVDLTGAIGITDGVSKMVVDLSPTTAKLMKHFGGKLEAFSVINVLECDCSYRENTTLHLKRPGMGSKLPQITNLIAFIVGFKIKPITRFGK